MIKISILSEEEGLESLRTEWNCLLQQSASDTIFLTWEWASAWWRSYRDGKELWLLRVEDNGELLALVPLYRKSVHKIFHYQGLYFIGDGSGDADYLDIIIRSGREELVVRSLVQFLIKHQDQWDLLFLNEVPETSLGGKLLQQALREVGCYWQQTEVPSTYVTLPTSWAEYLKYLKPRMRTKVRSLMGQLEQSFLVRFDYCRRVEDLAPRLASLFDLHGRRWRTKGEAGVFISPEKRKFYLEMSELFLTRGWLRLYSLAADNHYIAHQYCFEYRNTIFLLQEGFDPEWEQYGVGNVLRAYVFRDCIERQIAVYDFLGGVTPHKLSWGGVVKKSLRNVIGLPTIKNRIFFEIPKAVALGKERLKTILPEPMLMWVRALNTRKSSFFDRM